MKCPHCGIVIKSSQQVWQERMLALGRCISCGVEKADNYRKCRTCRLKETARNKRAYRNKHPGLSA